MNRAPLLVTLVALASATASAATFPDAGLWVPVSINASDGGTVYLGDPTTDGQNNGRNVVGDNLRPAFFIASSATHFFFRLRIDTDPSGPGGLASYGWGILMDADGDPRDYDYVLMADGISEEVIYSQKTTKTLASDPSELSQVVLNRTVTSFTQPTQNIAISPVGQGTAGFSGHEDYFLDIATPLSVFYGTSADGGTTFSSTTPLRFWVGVSNSSRSITVDLGGTGAQPGPGTLVGTGTIPQTLCTADSQCGGAASGLVCGNGVCVSGCRGTGGNVCPTGQSCTSSTLAIGECITAGVPNLATPVDGSTIATKRPVISGTSAANATVDVYVDGAKVGTTIANASGAWTFTPTSDLSDGAHAAAATATVSGITSALSPAHIFTIDSTPPSAPVVLSPANGSVIGTPAPTVSGTADPGTTVTIYVDGTSRGTTVAGVDGSFSFTLPSSLAAGSHTVWATSSDAVGNASPSSTSNTFTVDLTAPAAPVIATPAHGATISDPTPSLTGTAEANSTVELFIDGVSRGTTTASPSGTWSFTAPELSEGAHAVYATARDAAANLSLASASHDFTVDTQAPSAPVVLTPANGARVASDTPTYRGTAEPSSAVQVFVDGVFIGTTSADATGAWSIAQPLTLGDGAHTVRARTTDLAGNTSSDSSTNTFTVDTTAPAAPVVLAPATGTLTNDDTPSVSGTAEANSTVSIIIDGLTLGTATADATGQWTFTSTVLANGSHTVVARAVDAVGNTSPSSAPNTFTVDSLAPASPVVTGPSNGTITANPRPAIVGTAEANSVVTVFIDGAPAGTTTASSTGAWSFTPSATLTEGTHAVNATARDAAGNDSAASNSNTFTVDSQASTAPAITSPADGSNTTDTTPTITGTSDAPGLIITVRIDGQVSGVTVSTAGGAWSYVAPELPVGPHSVSATATDAASNVSPASATNAFTILPPPPPRPTLTGPVDGELSSDTTPTLSGLAEPNSTVTVRVDGEIVCTTSATAQGLFSCTPAQSLPPGEHVVTASAENAGGTSPQSPPTHFSIDTTPPLTPFVVGPAAGSSTTDTTPTITGTGEPGTLVAISVDGQRVGAVTIAADGTWSHELAAPLPLGSHQVSARATDAAGNQSLPSNTNPFSVVAPDTSRPTLTAPADNAALDTGTPRFQGTAVPGTVVSVLVDGQPVCTATAAPDGTWSCAPSQPLGPGLHVAVAEVRDGLGGALSSETRTFWVDTAAPSAPRVTGPAEGSSTTDPTPVLEGTAEALSTVQVFVDGVLIGSANADIDGNWSLAAFPLPLGAHTVSAIATDRAGNTSPSSGVNHFSVVAPNGAPVVLGPTAGTATGDSTPTVSGTSAPNADVEVLVDRVIVCTARATASGAWSCTPTTPLADGPHHVAAREPGSPTTSAPVPFAVDTVAPAAPQITAPTSNAFTSTTPSIAGTAEPGARVEVQVDGGAVCVTLADAQGRWSCVPPTPLAEGTHTATATATDVAGNVSPAATPVPFNVDLTAPSRPTLSAPASGSSSTDTTPRFSGDAEPHSAVSVRVDGVVVCTAVADAQGLFSCEASTALPRGTYVATATATDAAGNASLPSEPITFSIVPVTPPAPVITGPAGNLLLGDATPRITGTAEAGSTVTVRDTATQEVLCTATADAQGHWSCDSKPVADGGHSIAATAEKDEGTSLPSDPTTFRVDTTPPAVKVEGTPDQPIPSTTGTEFTWETEPETSYQCSVDGGPFQPCTSPLSLPGLTPGTHTITVRATDAAGNTTETDTTWLVEDPVVINWSVIGGGLSCAALPPDALAPLALVLLALRRRRR